MKAEEEEELVEPARSTDRARLTTEVCVGCFGSFLWPDSFLCQAGRSEKK